MFLQNYEWEITKNERFYAHIKWDNFNDTLILDLSEEAKKEKFESEIGKKREVFSEILLSFIEIDPYDNPYYTHMFLRSYFNELSKLTNNNYSIKEATINRKENMEEIYNYKHKYGKLEWVYPPPKLPKGAMT